MSGSRARAWAITALTASTALAVVVICPLLIFGPGDVVLDTTRVGGVWEWAVDVLSVAILIAVNARALIAVWRDER